MRIARLSSVGVILALCAATPTAAQSWDRGRLARSVDSIARDALRDGRTVGMTVAVVRGADTLLLKGYGQADRERGTPAAAEVVYPIGSVTKQFTAAAIVQLADQGRLSLDDELTKHLPEFTTHGHRVTLRHLIHHTSGVGGFTETPGFRPVQGRDAAPDEWLTRGVPGAPFGSAPGAAMVYSNSGYLLLGQVIERVTGTPWAEYVRRNLLQPAEMPRSHYCGEREAPPRAQGYTRRSRAWALTAWENRWAFSSGALCSTAGDLASWNRALHAGKLLSPGAYREMVTPGTLGNGAALRYAKGFVVDSAFRRRVIYHGGAINGYRSDLRYFPDDSLSIVVLANSESADPQAIAAAIAGMIYGNEVDEAPLVPANWREYAGTYRGPRRGGKNAVVVRIERGGLVVYTPATIRTRYVGGDTFEFDRARFTFLRTDGQITALRIDAPYSHSVMQRHK